MTVKQEVAILPICPDTASCFYSLLQWEEGKTCDLWWRKWCWSR